MWVRCAVRLCPDVVAALQVKVTRVIPLNAQGASRFGAGCSSASGSLENGWQCSSVYDAAVS